MTTAPTELKPSAPAVGGVRVKPLDNDAIMAVIRQCFPWQTQSEILALLTYEKSPPMFPQSTYDVPSYRAIGFVRAIEAAILSALEPQAVDDAMVERMARAHDKEEAAQRGEPSPWADPTIDAAWIAERITCMRAALQAAKAGE